MTWTKLGEEFPDAARDLPDAAYRTHVDALCWSNRRQLDLLVPKRDLRRFAETDDPDTAVKVLVEGGWWEDRGDAWYIGRRFGEWQLESAVVEQRREASAARSRRHRMHHAGDHSLCLPASPCRTDDASCNASRHASHDASRHGSPGTERNGTDLLGESTSIEDPEEGGGEGGPGEEPTFPAHCARHAHEPDPPPCGACRRARIAHDERQAEDRRADTLRPRRVCSFHRLEMPCSGCAGDAKGVNR